MKTFAIYFPQFYSIPVNEKAWGAYFTDWTLVANANLHQLWDTLVPEYYIKKFNPIFEFNVDKPIDYISFVEEHLNKNINIACLIYPNKPNETIIFEEYFNKEYLDTLFKNFHELSVGTFKYIFEG